MAIQVLTATLQLNKKDKMLYVPLHFREYENHGLLDTGAIRSAMSEDELRRILSAHPAALLEEYPAADFKVQIANGSIVPVRKQVLLGFFIGGKISEETFMILPTMGNILIGMSFFKMYSVTLDLANNVVKFPDITLTEARMRMVQNPDDRITNNTEDSDTSGPPDHCPRPSGKSPRHNSGHRRNLSGIRKEDTTTGVPRPDTNRRHEKSRPDHQPYLPYNYPQPKHDGGYLQDTDTQPSKKLATNVK